MKNPLTFNELKKAVDELKSREPNYVTAEQVAEYFKKREKTKKIIENGNVYIIVHERGTEKA